MTRPYLHDELFEINNNLTATLNDVGPYRYISIDNFYKRPEQICHLLSNSWAPNWKLYLSGSNNFKEYYDCKIPFPAQQKTIQSLQAVDLLETDLKHYHCNILYANMFSWINIPTPNIQFIPHIEDSLNVLVYMDKINSGGTALYENYEHNPDNNLDIDIRHDVKELKYHVIPAEFNKCVIFNGRIPHGKFIETHKKYSKEIWRQTLAYFLQHA